MLQWRMNTEKHCSIYGLDYGCNPMHTFMVVSPTEYKKWINMHRIVLCHIFKNMLIATIVSFLTPKCIQFHQPFYTGSTFQIFDLFLLTSYQFKYPTQLVASSMRQHKKHEWMTILPRQQPRSSQFPISHILSLNLFLSDCLIAVKVVYGQSSLNFKMSMLQRQLNGKPKHPRLQQWSKPWKEFLNVIPTGKVWAAHSF